MGNPGLLISHFAKFYGFVLIKGHVTGIENLSGVRIEGLDVEGVVLRRGLPADSPSVASSFGKDSGFELQILRRDNEALSDEIKIIFDFDDGDSVATDLLSSWKSHYSQSSANSLHEDFISRLCRIGSCSLLELGGRSRSGVDRSTSTYRDFRVTVLDICSSENVDIIGDAHELSSLVPPASFDAISSISVFEHLAMPWKVVLGMNHALRDGGLAFVQSHQTVGMHDLPWDFWRYSDSAWHALFNLKTGFEVLGTAMSHPQFIIPHHYWPAAVDAEKTGGFLASAVLVRKVGSCRNLDWDMAMSDLPLDAYPE